MPDASLVLSARGQVAALSRPRPDDDPEYIAARQKLKALGLEKHVREVIAAAPQLTDEQRERICALLRAGGAA